MALMNIPGPIKNNPRIGSSFFTEVLERIEEVLGNDLPQSFPLPEFEDRGGIFFTFAIDACTAEGKMVMIEETHPFGRLFDLDVLWMEGNDLKSISRTELGLNTRRCFICNRDAKDCGRSRRHTIEEMQHTISNIIQEGSDQLRGNPFYGNGLA